MTRGIHALLASAPVAIILSLATGLSQPVFSFKTLAVHCQCQLTAFVHTFCFRCCCCCCSMLQTGNTPQNAGMGTYGLFSNMTRVEYITEFSMWAISASHLIMTAPIMNCSAAPPPQPPPPPPPKEGCSTKLIKQFSQAPCVLGKHFQVFPPV